MVAFDNLEEIFQNWRNFNEYSKALVTLATAIGTVLIIIYFVKLLYATFEGFRLYVLSQYCCKGDFRKKYGQWVAISGATDGIGQSMAHEFARRGHSIIVIGRSDEKLARTKASLEAEDNVGEVMTIKIDLSDFSSDMYEKISRQIDPDNRDIGILVNNAGVFPDKFTQFVNMDVEKIRYMVNVNALAVVLLTRIILPSMVKRKRGLVVNVSSIIGSAPGPFFNVYGPTKTFLNAFSEMLQAEYASQPIDIINLTPGPVFTKLLTNTSKLPSSNPMFPTPDDYARSSVNTLATGIKSNSGIYMHGILHQLYHFSNSLALIPLAIRIQLRLTGKNVYLTDEDNESQQNSSGDGGLAATGGVQTAST